MRVILSLLPLALLAAAALAADESAADLFRRGLALEQAGKHAEAVAAFDRCLELDPKLAEAYDHRGSEQFKLGKVAESLADFDRYLKLKPAAAPGHWKRGISLYYVGRFADGKKQFEGYQTTDANDVENAVWHLLCNAKANGLEKARAEILKIGRDNRPYMTDVYLLFKGEKKPEDVLAAAEGKGKEWLFYTHLYLGLYHDVTGDRKKALEHMEQAAGKYRIGHYMGDVAAVHEKLLRGRAKR